MKFLELKVDRLKRELNKLELPTTGNKAELQKRLLEEFERRGINIDVYDFDDEEEMEVCPPAQTTSVDMNSLLAAIMQKMELQSQAVLAEVKESRAQSKAVLAEVKESREECKAQNQALEEKLEKSSRATNDRLTEISAILGKRVDCIEARVADLESAVEEKFNDVEHRINSLQCQRAESVRVIPEVSSRIRPPCFDGSTPFAVFKLQFETVASRNEWGSEEKALEIILALKGAAAEILETISASCRNNYEDLMLALQRKFGDEHKRDLYQMELRCRTQKANETLQTFAMEVERLVQLIYPGENHPLIDRFKTEAFVNGIRDPDVKLAVCSTQKATFAETVAFALGQETARVVSRQQVHKLRKAEVVPEGGDLKEVLEELLAERRYKAGAQVKCFNCGKSGHLRKYCKAPHKRARSVSPPGNSKRANQQQPSQESPLN